jgi:hypothetical protein
LSILSKLALLVLCATLSGCITFSWQRTAAFRAPAEGTLERLRPEVSDLEECLAVLGAPNEVAERADGFLLIYAWVDTSNKGVSARVPVTRFFDASLSYSRLSDRFQAVVLFFDQDARLTGLHEGLLGELRKQRRPLLIEDERKPAGGGVQ